MSSRSVPTCAKVLDLIADNVRRTNSFALSGAATCPVQERCFTVCLDGYFPSHTNVAVRDLWRLLLDTQLIDTPDVLNVKFRKPGSPKCARIEDLSHGQKTTRSSSCACGRGNLGRS